MSPEAWRFSGVVDRTYLSESTSPAGGGNGPTEASSGSAAKTLLFGSLDLSANRSLQRTATGRSPGCCR